jgi:protein-S-isoprenylcysteine O-methyltransferase Ste14
MVVYQNFTLGPWVYLALHGTYGFMWLLKDRIYPDKQWEQEISIGTGIFGFGLISLYWVAPFILISSGSEPPLPLVAAAISLNIMGVFLHYASDAQKYYTLKYRPGLITEGFFARCRNTNYLGEILIYGSFAMLAQHWLPFLILAGFSAGLFLPNMRKKTSPSPATLSLRTTKHALDFCCHDCLCLQLRIQRTQSWLRKLGSTYKHLNEDALLTVFKSLF